MATRRKRAEPKIPALHACPVCGLHIQRGRGPHGLAFHECIAKSGLSAALRSDSTLSQEMVEALMLRQLLEDVHHERLTSVQALEALASLRKASGGKLGVRGDRLPSKDDKDGELEAFVTGAAPGGG